ncbi:hypothetical protein CAPTEDRAFT_198811 [Capitella teleta]|uniref:EGF-like domain-containing protein n=1 Tax=Capitella teleta TaxID=283909 RepID=R7VKH9_CAPTE|nr:hypothetical protein CAPTEDRAFT_198811 [Capitella teleta]|eukprot:ELU17386.1 hypothetical protein CAPTEDRAFT_198811 [Capitella teleta]
MNMSLSRRYKTRCESIQSWKPRRDRNLPALTSLNTLHPVFTNPIITKTIRECVVLYISCGCPGTIIPTSRYNHAFGAVLGFGGLGFDVLSQLATGEHTITMATSTFDFIFATTLSLCFFVSIMAAPSDFDELFGEEDPNMQGEEYTMQEKRGGYRPVPFPCNGYDYQPRCLHGGRGPRKTWTKTGRFCVCLCAQKYGGPECSFTAESQQWKRLVSGGKHW